MLYIYYIPSLVLFLRIIPEGLKLQRNVDHYRILQVEGNQPTQIEDEDKNLFIYTRTALDLLGFSVEEVVNIFRVIAIILKLGNLEFVPCNNIDDTEGCAINNDYELYDVCELLGLEPRWLQTVLTSRQIEDGISTDLNASEATRFKNGLCRALYSRLFTWLINKINCFMKVSCNIYQTDVFINLCFIDQTIGEEKVVGYS